MAKGLERRKDEDGGGSLKRSNVSVLLKEVAAKIEKETGRQIMKSTMLPSNKPLAAPGKHIQILETGRNIDWSTVSSDCHKEPHSGKTG